MKKTHRLEFIILTAIFLIVIFCSFLLGRYSVSFSSLIKALPELLHSGGQAFGSTDLSVVFRIRMPRIAAAVLIGAALSTAGASYQGMFRNPMVSPDILGASTGAGFGAALGILLGFNYLGITLTAFLFGLSAVFLAYMISRKSQIDRILALVLSGMMISSIFTSCTSFVKLMADPKDQLPAITYWLMGSLASIKLADLPFAAIPIVSGLIPLFLLRWRINLLTVSEDEAKSLGINTGRLRLIVIICATLITAASVSVSGMIGWVGLVIPHICRMIFGYDFRRLIPATVLLGAAFLLVVDNIARIAMTSEIPLGILTSFVGAPLFVYLILTGGRDRER
ncbi:MAG TPA: iron ABC transporter permease [Bacillota bacterium]|nr:iron ABC transporter permease [Bacillota bacterium]